MSECMIYHVEQAERQRMSAWIEKKGEKNYPYVLVRINEGGREENENKQNTILCHWISNLRDFE
jgi:hypothetical protein